MLIFAVVALICVGVYAAVHFTWIRPARRTGDEGTIVRFPGIGWLLDWEAASLGRREAELDSLNRRAAARAEADKAPPAPVGYAERYRGLCSYRGISEQGYVELNLNAPLAMASGEPTQWITTSVRFPVEDIIGVHWALRGIFAGQKITVVATPHRVHWMDVRFSDGLTLEAWIRQEIARSVAPRVQPAPSRLPKNTLN